MNNRIARLLMGGAGYWLAELLERTHERKGPKSASNSLEIVPKRALTRFLRFLLKVRCALLLDELVNF